MKITILGNSVSLRNRPVEKYPNNKNYGMLLDEKLSDDFDLIVSNKGIGRATILDINERLDDYINEFPDYYILNIGVCDAATRPIPLWYAEIINNKKNTILKSILGSIYYRFIKNHSAFFVRLRAYKSWVSEKKFRKEFELLVSELSNDTNARLIVLSINKINDRVESIVPGSGIKYELYNSIMKDISAKYNQSFIDTTDLSDIEYYPDGTHYNLVGNKEIADRIYKVIKESV